MKMNRAVALTAGTILLLLSAPRDWDQGVQPSSPPSTTGTAQQPDAAGVATNMQKARAFVQRKDYARAIDAFEKADSVSHHTCASCLVELFQLQRRLGLMSDALDTAKKAEKEAGEDKISAAQAHLIRGVLLGEMAKKPSDKKNAEAADEMRQAIALYPSDLIAHYDLGYELMKSGNDADGIAELKMYMVSDKAEPRLVEKAKEMIADPRRAREPFAPNFSFSALEGGTISLESLKGKVGLLDFWGTWCPPCRESIPTMVRLNKEFAGKPVEIVGISSDDDEQAWRTFIAKNQMSWAEYRDADGAVQNAFDVDSFPTYVVLNREGVIRFRQSGFGEDTGSSLEDAVKKALKEKPETGESVASAASSSAQGSPTVAQTSSSPAIPPQTGAKELKPGMVVTGAEAEKLAQTPTGRVGLALRVQVITQPASADVAAYVKDLMKNLTQIWAQNVFGQGLMSAKGTVAVQFAISREGNLADTPEVTQTGGNNPGCSKAALDAVEDLFSVEPLPDSFTGSQLELRVTFLYNEPVTPLSPMSKP